MAIAARNDVAPEPDLRAALALENIREAIEAYIEALLEDGPAVPVERGRETVEIEVAARWTKLPRGLSG